MPSHDVLGKTKMPVDVAAVESKAQRVFGPEMLASDRTWDPLECFGLWWYLFLGPLRKPLQQLGRKYLNRPAALPAFRRQAERIANRHLRKLARDPVDSQHLARFISLRQRVYDQCARVLCSEEGQGELYEEALRIRMSGAHPKRTTHHICVRLVPGYSEMRPYEQIQARRTMDRGIKRAERRQTEQQARSGHLAGSVRGLSRSKVVAASYGLDLFEALFMGRPLVADPKKVLASIKAFAAPDGGRPRKKVTKSPR